MNFFSLFILQTFFFMLYSLGLRPHQPADTFYQLQRPTLEFGRRRKISEPAIKDEHEETILTIEQTRNKAEEVKSEIKQDEKEVEKLEKAMQAEPTPSEQDLEKMEPLAKADEALAEVNAQQDLVNESVSSVNDADTNTKMAEKVSNEKEKENDAILAEEEDAKGESLAERAKQIGINAINDLHGK